MISTDELRKHIMLIKANKPKFTTQEMFIKLCEKGITFKSCSENEVCEYIYKHNNFLRLYSYRKNFEYLASSDTYKDLDFEHLRTLAITDMIYRKELLGMCIDIEHRLKILLLEDFEKRPEDGYEIVQQYFKICPQAAQTIYNGKTSGYAGELVEKYVLKATSEKNNLCVFEKYYYLCVPIWVLMEVLPFGLFLKFYEFYYNKYGIKPPLDRNILSSVKCVRNACAHNNCMLNNLNKGGTNPNKAVDRFLNKNRLTGAAIRKRVSCRVVYEILCVFYSYDSLSENRSKVHVYRKINKLLIISKQKYSAIFAKNLVISPTYALFAKLTKNLLKKSLKPIDKKLKV